MSINRRAEALTVCPCDDEAGQCRCRPCRACKCIKAADAFRQDRPNRRCRSCEKGCKPGGQPAAKCDPPQSRESPSIVPIQREGRVCTKCDQFKLETDYFNRKDSPSRRCKDCENGKRMRTTNQRLKPRHIAAKTRTVTPDIQAAARAAVAAARTKAGLGAPNAKRQRVIEVEPYELLCPLSDTESDCPASSSDSEFSSDFSIDSDSESPSDPESIAPTEPDSDGESVVLVNPSYASDSESEDGVSAISPEVEVLVVSPEAEVLVVSPEAEVLVVSSEVEAPVSDLEAKMPVADPEIEALVEAPSPVIEAPKPMSEPLTHRRGLKRFIGPTRLRLLDAIVRQTRRADEAYEPTLARQKRDPQRVAEAYETTLAQVDTWRDEMMRVSRPQMYDAERDLSPHEIDLYKTALAIDEPAASAWKHIGLRERIGYA